MDPYSYVGDNPETKTDPTGQRITCGADDCGPPPPPQPKSDPTGGCGTGEHQGTGGCVYDGGACAGRGAGDFQPGSGGCVYSSGQCHGRTVAGCDTYKKHKAYADAAKARDHFQSIANFLGGPIFLLITTITSLIGSALGIFFGPVAAIKIGRAHV